MEKDPVEASLLLGRHSVLEALRASRSIDKIFLLEGRHDREFGEITRRARQEGIPFFFVPREKLDSLAGGGRHQGVAAVAPTREYATVEEMLERASARKEAPLLLALNKVQDPHNLGSIIRSAEACGAHGVILPVRDSCHLTAAVGRAAAGADAYMAVAKVNNLVNALKDLKNKGLWIIGADGEAPLPCTRADLTAPTVLVMGGEDAGLGRLVKDTCDVLVKIPMKGRIASLNVSVSAAILLFECLRQREGR